MDQHNKALELFKGNHSCAQSILVAFAQEVELDTEVAFKIGATLGGGIGRSQNICGAINAGAIILGLKFGNYEPDDIESKNKLAELTGRFIDECKQKLGATQCLELTKVDLNNQDLKQFANDTGHLARVCNNAVEQTAIITTKYLATRV